MQESAAYAEWHKHEYHGHYHWALFLFASGFLLWTSFSLARFDIEPTFAQVQSQYADNFDTDPYSGRWANEIKSAVWDSANQELDIADDNDVVIRYATSLGSIEHEAQVTARANTNARLVGPGVRWDSVGLDEGYGMTIENGGLNLYRWNAGVRTGLTTLQMPVTFTAGNYYTMRLSATGGAGNSVVLEIWVVDHGSTKPSDPGWIGSDNSSQGIFTDTSATRLDEINNMNGAIAGRGSTSVYDHQHDYFKVRTLAARGTTLPPPPPPPPPTTSDIISPTVSITSPVSGSTVSGTSVTLSANASDNIGVSGVQFRLDSSNLGTEDTSAPYSITWNTTGSTDGSHTLTAVARDAAGNTTISPGVTVTVSNVVAPPPVDTIVPTVSITTPTNVSTVSGSSVTVSANASDNLGVSGVQFRLDSINLGAEDTSAPYSIVWNTTSATNGSHALTAVARDAAGNTTTSSGIVVTVSNTTLPPPTTGGLIIFDNFEYAVNKFDSGTAKQNAFISAGWSTAKDEQTRPDGANGYLSTVTSIPGYTGTFPSGGSRVLLLEGLPTSMGDFSGASGTYQNQTDFYLELGNGTDDYIPGDVWFQFWAYPQYYGNQLSSISNRNKFLYPCNSSYGCHTHLWIGHSAARADPPLLDPSPFGNPSQGDVLFGLTESAGLSNIEYTGPNYNPYATGNIGQQTLSEWPRENRWTLVKMHFNTTRTSGNSWEMWLQPMGGSWTKVAEWIGGVTPGFVWDIPSGSEGGHRTLRMPSTWGTANSNDSTNYDAWLYLDDFAMATSESALPTYSGTTAPPPPPPSTTPTPPSRFGINDRIQTTSNVNVRSTAAGTSLGTQNLGALGTVASGPTYASLSGTSYWWWNVNFDTSIDGWVVDDFLSPYTAPPSAGDTTSPTVSLTAPTAGSTVSSNSVTVSGNASDNIGISGVQFRLDGANLGAEDTSAPHSTTWNTTLTTNGSHTLTAVARDAAGNTTTSSNVTVNVSNVTTPPPTTGAPVVSNFSAQVRQGEARFRWTTDRPATSQVEYGSTISYGTQSSVSTLLRTSHEVIVPSLTAGNYNARAISIANSLSGLSSNTTFTVRSRPPRINTITASPGSIVLNWSPISFTGYSGIAILRSTTGYFNQYDANFEIARVTGSSYTDQSVIAGTTYYYSLFVYDDQENYSDPATVSFVAPASSTSTTPTPPPVVQPVSSGGGGGGGGGSTGSAGTSASIPGLLPSNFNSLPQSQKIAVLTAKILELQILMNTLFGGAAGQIPTPTSSCSFTRDLSLGSVGEDVKCLQKYLNTNGYAVAVTGNGSLGNESTYFGPSTQAALIRWQKAYSVSPFSGYFGSKSRAQYSALPK